MEAVCDDKLWIWSMDFGAPGPKNDVSILRESKAESKFFNDIRTGRWPPFTPNETLRARLSTVFVFWVTESAVGFVFYYASSLPANREG